VTADAFRSMALSLPEATESAHMGHPDFRVRQKIFATLGYPDNSYGMVKLTPEQQERFVRNEPEVFVPAAGGWGRRGSSTVHLAKATEDLVFTALVAAWGNVAPKRLVAGFLTGKGEKRGRGEDPTHGDGALDNPKPDNHGPGIGYDAASADTQRKRRAGRRP
jgi:hypothetical protein